MRSGDWVLFDAQQGDERFELYSEAKDGRQISIRAKREFRTEYDLIEVMLDEILYLNARHGSGFQSHGTSLKFSSDYKQS